MSMVDGLRRISEEGYTFAGDAADEIDRLNAEIDELKVKVDHLKTNRDYWYESCQQAQDHRDGANAKLVSLEAENKSLEEKIESLEDELYPYTATHPREAE